MKKICAIFSSIAFMLSGCSDTKAKDYINVTPKLDIREYLNGKLEAWGVIFDYSGKADRHFYVTMDGSWKGNVGTLAEEFTFNDGKKDYRTWTIEFQDDNNFTAQAHDVIGKAIGTQYGNAVNMKYVLNAKRDNGDTIELSMDDWLYLVDKKTLINKTKIKKFGLAVGELVVVFHKI